MKLKKNILFISHGNNDLDHYLPIICNLNHRQFKPCLFYIPDSESSTISNFHLQILNKKKIKVIYSENLVENKILKKILNLSHKIKKIKLLNIDRRFIFKTLHYFDYLVGKILILLFNKNKFEKNILKFIKKFNFKLCIIDIFHIDKFDSKKYLHNFFIFNFLSISKKSKIPIFMVSHGVNIFYDKDKKIEKKNIKNLKADLLSVCNKHEIDLYKSCAKNFKSVKILGDLRYDSIWLKFISRENKKINSRIGKNGKLKILYIMGNLKFLDKPDVEIEINEQIKNLVKDFENIELWVKIHPRTNLPFKSLDNDKSIKIFDRKIDSSYLIDKADVILTTHSGLLSQSILQKKKSILYESWRKNFKNVWTIFDKTPCVKKVFNYDELKHEIQNYKKEIKKYKKKDIEKFYKNYISGNRVLKESIIKSYLLEIDNLISNRKNVYN